MLRTSCIVFATLALVFGAATTALAQGGPPDHAAKAGPTSPDRGPPAHAEAPHAGSSGDDGSHAATESATTGETAGSASLHHASSGDGAGPETGSGFPMADGEVRSSPNGADGAPATQGADTTPDTLTGLVPGALIGAVGVLALAVHHSPRRTRVHPETATEPSEEVAETEPEEPEASTGEATATEGGVVGVITAGQEALDNGDVEAAVGWFETALELAPNLQVAHFCLGLCLDELGRLEEAERRLRAARELEDDPMSAYAHASVLARLGRTREAVEVLERLTSRVPDLREQIREDDELANLRDHPRFLALLGEL